jgi:hypothetical protein
MTEDISNIANKEHYQYDKNKVVEYTPKEQDEEYQIQMEGIPMPITFGKYGLFLHLSNKDQNKKRGYNIAWDAYLIYQHLIYTGIMQKTNSVWANNTYIANGLNITSERVRQAKNLLKDMGLIEYQKDQKKEKDEKGLFAKQYIKVITVTPLSHSPLNPLTAQTATNALSNKENALSNKENIESKDKSLPFPNKQKKEDNNNQGITITKEQEEEKKKEKSSAKKEKRKEEIDKRKLLNKGLKKMFNNKLLTVYSQESINKYIFKVEKERTQFNNILNKFEDLMSFSEFLEEAFSHWMVISNNYMPSTISSQYSKIMGGIMIKKKERKENNLPPQYPKENNKEINWETGLLDKINIS